jgi:hypothetical protein
MPAAFVGALRILMSADSAQITSDLGKARKAVSDSRADFALFGRTGKDANQVLIDTTSAASLKMKDAREVSQLLGRALGGMGGQAAKATLFFTELATEGLGGFTLAAGAAAAAVTFAVGTISQAWKDYKGAQDDAVKFGVDAMRRIREYAGERFDALHGTNLSGTAAAEQKVTEAVEARARAYRAMQDAGPTSIVGATRAHLAAEEAVNEALRERARVYDRLQGSVRKAAEGLDAAMKEVAAGREQDYLLARLPADAQKAEREIASLTRTMQGLVAKVGMSEEDARAAVVAGLVDYGIARDLARERADAEKRAAQFLQEQANAIRRRVAADSFAALDAEVKAAEEELRFKELGLDADRKDFEIRQRIAALEGGAHRFDLENPDSAVNRRIALMTRLLHLNRQAKQIEEEPAREAAAERARALYAEVEAAGRAAAESRERDRQREMDALSEALGARLEFENRYYETVADLSRTETEREVRAVEQRYAELLDEARAYGLDTVELQRWIESEKARVRADGAEADREKAREARARQLQESVSGEGFGEGFSGRVSQLREQMAGFGEIGAQVADVAVSGFGNLAGAITEVSRGFKTAKQAAREFFADLAFQIAETIQRALLMKAILSIFPGLSSAPAEGTPAAVPAPANAHGGTWRVGGFGGLDSKIAALRVSPGELIRVTNGANRGGGEAGDVHVSLVTRPVVVAEEMASRMSREAKAGLVASALQRGSRRGARAAE